MRRRYTGGLSEVGFFAASARIRQGALAARLRSGIVGAVSATLAGLPLFHGDDGIARGRPRLTRHAGTATRPDRRRAIAVPRSPCRDARATLRRRRYARD